MSQEEKPVEIPNQHLADRIAGKVDLKGNPIILKEEPKKEEPKEPEIPNQHLADRIAGKVDLMGNEIEQKEIDNKNSEEEVKEKSTQLPENEILDEKPVQLELEPAKKEISENPVKEKSTKLDVGAPVPNQHLADRIAGKVDLMGNKVVKKNDPEAPIEEKKKEGKKIRLSEMVGKTNSQKPEPAEDEAIKMEGEDIITEEIPQTIGSFRVEESETEISPETVDEGSYAEDHNELDSE